MTPFHPKLRRALLLDPEHRQKGLTPELLQKYEGLVTQLFYTTYYPPESEQNKGNKNPQQPTTHSSEKQPLEDKIREFRKQYLPNYEKIHKKWVDKQCKSMSKHYFSLKIGKICK